MKSTIPLEGDSYNPVSHIDEIEENFDEEAKELLEFLDYEDFLRELDQNLE